MPYASHPFCVPGLLRPPRENAPYPSDLQRTNKINVINLLQAFGQGYGSSLPLGESNKLDQFRVDCKYNAHLFLSKNKPST